MGCMIHYNWGTIKYELGPDKLFVDIKGIEDYISRMFKTLEKDQVKDIIKGFRKEIFANCQARGLWGEDFRISEVCEKIGFDPKDMMEKESFWLCYDDAEVTKAERVN